MATATVVLQSAPEARPGWVSECLSSVERWCVIAGYRRQFMDDSFFACLPDWFWSKVQHRPPMAADLARLLHARRLLDEGADRVIWIDADTLVLNPQWRVPDCYHTAFGKEHWLQRDDRNRWQVIQQPHNAFCVFRHDSPVLDFLIYAAQSIIERADPAFLAPQMIGPKLLKALHNLVAFDVLPCAGAVSPDLLRAAIEGNNPALEIYRQRYSGPMHVVNLCQSLTTSEQAVQAMASVVVQPERLRPLALAITPN